MGGAGMDDGESWSARKFVAFALVSRRSGCGGGRGETNGMTKRQTWIRRGLDRYGLRVSEVVKIPQ